MALTQSQWTRKSVGKSAVFTCTVVSTVAENDAYTLKTPDSLDTTKPFTLLYKASATPDGQALPLEIYVGYGTDFLMTGDGGTIGATSGAKFKQICDDVVLAVSPLVYAFQITPTPMQGTVADVVTAAAIATGFKVQVPPAPYYAFNLNGGSTLAAVTHTFVIVQ